MGLGALCSGSRAQRRGSLLLARPLLLSLAQHAGLLTGRSRDQSRAPAAAVLRLDKGDLAAGCQPAHTGVEPLLEAEWGEAALRSLLPLLPCGLTQAHPLGITSLLRAVLGKT